MALLPPLLANTLTTTSPSFILLSDSLLQPGLLLLRQFITTTLDRNEQVVVISLEQSPSRLIPRNNSNSSATQNQHVDLVDCVSVPPFASTSTLPAGLVNLHEKGGVQLLEKSALEAVRRRKAAAGAGGKVLVVLDSVDALAEKGVHAVFSLLRKVLKELEGSSGESVMSSQILHCKAKPSFARFPPHRTAPQPLPHSSLTNSTRSFSPPNTALPFPLLHHNPPQPPPFPSDRTPLSRLWPLYPSSSHPDKPSRPTSNLLHRIIHLSILGRSILETYKFGSRG